MRLAIAALLLLSSAIAVADPPPTIRDLEWGSPPSALGTKAFKMSSNSSIELYRRRNEDLKVADAMLANVDYIYYNNRLMSVILNYDGWDNFNSLKTALEQQYGASQQPNQQQYLWNMSDVSVTLSYKRAAKRGSVLYTYTPASLEMQHDANARVQKAKGKLW
jgi:hypothetical protein